MTEQITAHQPLPSLAGEQIAAFALAVRDETLDMAASRLDRIADEAEAKVAEYYGAGSGIGPGSAEMVRECARTIRSLISGAKAAT